VSAAGEESWDPKSRDDCSEWLFLFPIQAVRPDNFDTGGVFVKVIGARSGAQTCPFPDGGAYNWYFIGKSNVMMKELLSAALGAKLGEKSVTVVGKGTCTQGYEDVRYIEIN
jgi:hypothetical protein